MQDAIYFVLAIFFFGTLIYMVFSNLFSLKNLGGKKGQNSLPEEELNKMYRCLRLAIHDLCYGNRTIESRPYCYSFNIKKEYREIFVSGTRVLECFNIQVKLCQFGEILISINEKISARCLNVYDAICVVENLMVAEDKKYLA